MSHRRGHWGDAAISTRRRPRAHRTTGKPFRIGRAAFLLAAAHAAAFASNDTIVVELPLPPRAEVSSTRAATPMTVRLAPVETREPVSSVATPTAPSNEPSATPIIEPAASSTHSSSDDVLGPPPPLARFEQLEVKRGQSLYLLFSEHNLAHGDLMQMLAAGDSIKRRLSRLKPGQIVHVNLDQDRRILHLLVGEKTDKPLLVTRGRDRFRVSDGMWLVEIERRQARAAERAAATDTTSNRAPVASTADDGAAARSATSQRTETARDALASQRLTLARGQSLYQLFTDHKLSRVDLLAMLRSDAATGRRLSRVRAGQELVIEHRGPDIERLRLVTHGPTDLLVERINDRYVSRDVPDEAPVAKVEPSQPSRQPSAQARVDDDTERASSTARDDSDPIAAFAGESAMTALPAPVVYHELEVKRGDSLSLIFDRLSIPATEVATLMSNADGKQLKRLRPGQIITLKLLADNTLLSLSTELDEVRTLDATRDETGKLRVVITENPLERRVTTASGIIEGSLFASGQQAGISDRVIMQLVEIFGWDVDFALDVRAGDRFSVIYESLYKDGELLRDGNILAAEFVNRGRTIRGLRYSDNTGATAYFSPDGLSMRKAFLRTPVKFSRISSRFSLSRRHPILNRIRAHKGVDYAAPRGTPIKAAGNGRVVFSGWKKGYGRTVVIQHGQVYSTLYAHMSRIHKRAGKGRRVRQGEVIGYIGSTGLATGPHLHYEFRVRGVHKDPLKVKLPKALPIEKKYRADFLRKAEPLVAELDLLSSRNLAASRGSAAEIGAEQ